MPLRTGEVLSLSISSNISTHISGGVLKMNHPLLVLVTAASLIAQAADENKAVFQDMCRILRLTLSPPEIPKLPDSLVVKDQAEKVLNHIRMLNFSLTDQPLYNEIMKAEKLGDTKDVQDSTKSLSNSDWTFLKANFDKIKGSGPDSLAQKFPRPLSETARGRAHRKVAQILEKANKLYEKLSKDEFNLESAVAKAHKSLVAAAYGSGVATTAFDGPEAKTESLEKKSIAAASTSFYTNSASQGGCFGGAAGGDKPGLSLAADILCLCDKAGSGIATGGICGLGLSSSHGVAWAAPETGLNAWRALASKCTDKPTDEETPAPTPENLAAALARFYGLLGTGGDSAGEGSLNAAGMKGRSNILGHFVTYQTGGPKCDGDDTITTAAHGVCVNYNALIESGKEIEWVKNVKTAMEQLRQVRDIFSHQKDILTKMEMLEQNGLQIYEDSREAPESPTNDLKATKPEKGIVTSQDGQAATVASQKESSGPAGAHVEKLSKLITIAVVLIL